MSLAAMFGELFAGTTVHIDTGRCLNARHDSAGCSRCVDVCPTGAIRLHGPVPTVADDLCVRCGACVPACPPDAVIASDLAERRLLEACDSLDSTAVTVTCALNPHPQPGTPTEAMVRHGRCLAALGASQLLAITRTGTRRVTLDLSWCNQCPIGATAAAVIATADTCATLHDLFEAPQMIAAIKAPDIEESRTPSGGVLDSQRIPTTRRGLFTGLRRRVQTAAERAAASPPPPMRRARGPVTHRLPHSLPTSRRRLLDEIAVLDAQHSRADGGQRKVATATLPFSPITVDANSCSGCGLCARYCPSGALSFTTSPTSTRVPDNFSLTFRVDYCIDCHICAAACPEDAVAFDTNIVRDALTRFHWTPVAFGPLVACSSCGLPTAPVGPIPTRCFSCRLGTGVVTSLRDDAGLMADLLSRLPPSGPD